MHSKLNTVQKWHSLCRKQTEKVCNNLFAMVKFIVTITINHSSMFHTPPITMAIQGGASACRASWQPSSIILYFCHLHEMNVFVASTPGENCDFQIPQSLYNIHTAVRAPTGHSPDAENECDTTKWGKIIGE